MREIKFRGKRADNGQFVYGDLMHECDITYVGGWRVDPESIAQLVGRDKNGRPVYEGDFIIEPSGDVARVDYQDNPAYIKLCKLEEAA